MFLKHIKRLICLYWKCRATERDRNIFYLQVNSSQKPQYLLGWSKAGSKDLPSSLPWMHGLRIWAVLRLPQARSRELDLKGSSRMPVPQVKAQPTTELSLSCTILKEKKNSNSNEWSQDRIQILSSGSEQKGIRRVWMTASLPFSCEADSWGTLSLLPCDELSGLEVDTLIG